MRHLYFLVPGTGKRFHCGGLFAELKTLKLAQQVCSAEVVTYDQREADTLFLDDLLQQPNLSDSIFVVSWGFHVPRLVKRLRGYPVVYHAHSSGYGFNLPGDIPIITVSRNSMGYWGQKRPNGLIFHLPNHISPEFTNRQQLRDIDVLVQTRKSSSYLLNQLVPTLEPHCNLVKLEGFVDDLSILFNRSKIFLYDSAEYWALSRVSEGFGLPPMEAMACGCQVFTSVNGALADYLDPGFNCYKIGVYSAGYDCDRILAALQTANPLAMTPEELIPYRADALLPRLRVILAEINHFFDYRAKHSTDIPNLTKPRLTRLWLQRTAAKVRKKLKGR
ncbi:glycosyltransferase [Nodosilinea sp. LEGE 06152]|uniref:glycosyltransferase n=1 Tax=Nodosilinea sp. LEGE 06152 TaxID=2777966 RepID=UPI001882F69C|nr:glycosyltransferase [Nodosilinea sp. LEGE 06152]MBE9158567.1 glycosyltransferase [Nodosilinea sp. LEGE 06152]